MLIVAAGSSLPHDLITDLVRARIMSILNSRLIIFVLGIVCTDFGWAQVAEKSFVIQYESPVLIKRGDAEVSLADFNAYLDWQVPKKDHVALVANPDRIERVLENIALTESFYGLAAREGLLEDPVIQARLYQAISREIRSIYGDWYRQSIELESYDAPARELYIVDADRFTKPARYDIEHLLIPVNQEQDAVQAMRLIVEAHEKISTGSRFTEVINTYGDVSEADTNGTLTNIDLDDLVRSVADAVSATELGKFSNPVQSSFGWHIIKVISIHPREKMTWEEARPLAQSLARDKHLVESFERILRDINSRPMQFADGAVHSILDYYGLDGFGINAVKPSDSGGDD